MTIGYVTSLRNTVMAAITAAIDAGASGGKIRVYDGTQPATGGTVTTLLAEATFSVTSYGAPSVGVITANSITGGTGLVAADGTWVRLLDSDDVFVIDGDFDVTASGAFMEANTVTFSIGVAFEVTGSVLTEGNP